MYDFEGLYLARSVDDAVRALAENENAVIISGGSDVLIKAREGELRGRTLVSVHGMPELTGVRLDENGDILIGAATVFSDIEANTDVNRLIPILARAAGVVGGPQTRNVGTIGGNVCNGVTSADSSAPLLSLDALLELRGPDGERAVPLREFYTGPGKTVRDRREVLTVIRIPRAGYEGFYGKYIKYGKREAMEIATLGCAANVRLSDDKKRIEELRLAYSVAAPTPMRCPMAEAKAEGALVCAELFEEVSECAVSEINPRTSWRASREFRLHIAGELCRRALSEAVNMAGGESGA